MDLIDRLSSIADRIPSLVDNIKTEEAAKNAFVMPFIQALGYNVFDPTEVVPEYNADVGTKKGEKVDYAIMRDGAPVMLFECKWEGGKLLSDKHVNQLYRYFSVTKARIGVLTNGIIYNFYSDLDEPNKMDTSPFLVLDMNDLREGLVRELRRLVKDTFDLDDMLSIAGELKHTRAIKALLNEELSKPSDDFVRLVASKVYSGKKVTQAVREQFSKFIPRAFRHLINDELNARFKTAFKASSDTEDGGDSAKAEDSADKPKAASSSESEIVTTQQELEGYYAVKSILRETVGADRIAIRDSKRYCAILLDDNNRKPLCRLWFNGVRKKHVGLFDENKKETKELVESVDDIYKHAAQIIATAQHYEKASKQSDKKDPPAEG